MDKMLCLDAKVLGSLISHTQFGRGKVIELTEKSITVEFLDIDKVAKFAYPQAFASFLIFDDISYQEAVKQDLEMVEQQKQQLQEERLKRYQAYEEAYLQKKAPVKRKSTTKTKATTAKKKKAEDTGEAV